MPERLKLICFRCRQPMFDRLERFAWNYRLDRTSVINLALVSFFRTIEERESSGEGWKLEDLAKLLGSEEGVSSAPFDDFRA